MYTPLFIHSYIEEYLKRTYRPKASLARELGISKQAFDLFLKKNKCMNGINTCKLINWIIEQEKEKK